MAANLQTKNPAVKVDIQLLGKPYAVACEAGEEKRLETLAGYVDSKLRTLAGSLSSATQERLFMLACLMLADEVFDLKSSTAHKAESEATEAAVAGAIESLTERLARITQRLQG
ncbi:MAG: cell division protein ZapA [Bdellovibrionales bacterium]